jgi:beta-lactamase class A
VPQHRLTRNQASVVNDLVAYAPIIERLVEDGMTVGSICDAAIRSSGNTAAGLLLEDLYGPEALAAGRMGS